MDIVVRILTGVDAFKIPHDLVDDAERYNCVQDIFSSRCYWASLDIVIREFIRKSLPEYIKIYMQFNQDLCEKEIAQQLYSWLESKHDLFA